MAKKHIMDTKADVQPSTNGTVPDDEALTVAEETGETSTQIDELLDVADLYVSPDDDTDAPIQITRIPPTITIWEPPSKSMWFTVCPDPNYTNVVVIYPHSAQSSKTLYLVKGHALQKEMCQRYGARKRRLYLIQDTDRTLGLWSIGMPGPDGTVNPWVQSAERALEYGKHGFIHIAANTALQEYDIDIGTSPLLPRVEWPEISFDDLMRRVKKGNILQEGDHALLRRLREGV
jgi:hypothetical protein